MVVHNRPDSAVDDTKVAVLVVVRSHRPMEHASQAEGLPVVDTLVMTACAATQAVGPVVEHICLTFFLMELDCGVLSLSYFIQGSNSYCVMRNTLSNIPLPTLQRSVFYNGDKVDVTCRQERHCVTK